MVLQKLHITNELTLILLTSLGNLTDEQSIHFFFFALPKVLLKTADSVQRVNLSAHK